MADTIFVILYFTALTALSLFGLHKYFLIYLYRKYRNQPLPKPVLPEEWPEVCVQLPVFNERYVVERLIRATAALNYPREKLHIQLLDDSTDATTAIAAKVIGELREKGFRIEHIRRPERRGYKAGALDYGLNRISAEYIAVFDADFVPHPDFLKETIPYLLQPGIGMVQTRWGHLNRDYSLLTQIQAIFLDAHFLIEHLARHRTGRFFNFNGTAGVWRKKAIQDAGGWQHDTLTEDLDLSYRAQLVGWKFLFLPDVVSPAELPVDVNAYKSQQHRWAKGSVQTAMKLIPTIWRSDFPFFVKLEATIHLSNNFAYLLMAIPSLLILPVLKFQVESDLWWPLILYLTIFFSATVSVVVYYLHAIKAGLGRLWPEVLYLPGLISLGIGLSINNGRAALEALLGRQSGFVRTPKFCIEGKRSSVGKRRYRLRRNYFFLIELAFAGYFTAGMVYFIQMGYYYSLPFFLLFQFGFFYLGINSMLAERS
ncbi:MAG: glycosyltransferase family 2 protein [Calditrichia bacterium]